MHPDIQYTFSPNLKVRSLEKKKLHNMVFSFLATKNEVKEVKKATNSQQKVKEYS